MNRFGYFDNFMNRSLWNIYIFLNSRLFLGTSLSMVSISLFFLANIFFGRKMDGMRRSAYCDTFRTRCRTLYNRSDRDFIYCGKCDWNHYSHNFETQMTKRSARCTDSFWSISRYLNIYDCIFWREATQGVFSDVRVIFGARHSQNQRKT